MVILNSTPGVKRIYVDAQIKSVNDKIGTTAITGDTLTAAIKALQDSVGADGEVGKKVTQLTNALGYTAADYNADGTLKTDVKSIDTRLDALETTIDTASTGLTARVGAIETSLTETGDVGRLIAANAAAIKTLQETTVPAAIQTSKDYTDDKIGTLAEGKTVVELIGAAQADADDAQATLGYSIVSGTGQQAKTVDTRLNAIEASIGTGGGLEARVKANEDKLAGISSTVTSAISTAVGSLKLSDAEGAQTYTNATELAKAAEAAAEGYTDTKIGTLKGATVVADIATAKSEAITAVQGNTKTTVEGLEATVNALGKATADGKGLESGAAKEYVDAEVKKVTDKIGTAYVFRGSCAYGSLPSNAAVGDVWNVTDAHVEGNNTYPAGTNYAWNGSVWDALGGYTDLSVYADKATVNAVLTSISTDLTHLDTTIENIDAGSEKKHVKANAAIVKDTAKGTNLTATFSDSTAFPTGADVDYIVSYSDDVAAYNAGITVTAVSATGITFNLDYAVETAFTVSVVALPGATSVHDATHNAGAFPSGNYPAKS